MKLTPDDLKKMGRCEECGHRDCDCEDAPQPTQSRSQPTVKTRVGAPIYVGGRHVIFRVDGRPPRKRDGHYAARVNAQVKDKVKWSIAPALGPVWPTAHPCALAVVAVYPDGRVGDLANVIKAVEDGLTGVVWEDDRQVRDYVEPTTRRVSDHLDEGLTLVLVEVLG